MRDRLIEMLNFVRCKADCCGALDGDRCGDLDRLDRCQIESIADHLLAHNVVALSCNVGDKVYENYHGRIFEYAVTSIEILSSYKILYKVQSTESWNHWVRFIGFNKYDIGKTIFLNREDAERALKGGEG